MPGRLIPQQLRLPGSTLRRKLITLLLIALIPAFLVQLFLGISWVSSLYSREILRNMELARGVGLAFTAFTRDLTRSSRVIAISILEPEPISQEEARNLLRATQAQYPAMYQISLLSPDGTVLHSSLDRPQALNLHEEPVRFFAENPETTFHVSNVYPEGFNGAPVYTVSLDVRLENDAEAIVVAMINPDILGELVLNLERPEGGFFGLFDGNGYVAYRSPEIPEEGIRRRWVQTDHLLRQALEGREAWGMYTSPVDRGWRIGARTPILAFGWVASASVTLGTIIYPIIGEALLALGVMALTIVLVITLGGAGIRGVLFSLDKLGTHAGALSRGDFTHKTDTTGIAEFDTLVDDFNNLGNQLQIRDQQIKRRTAELERSSQELEQFAYVASHDLQEPLRTISGYIQLIERRYKGKLDSDADEFIAFAVKGAKRLQSLITDLLAYSRVGTRGKPFFPTDAGRVLQDVLQVLGGAVESSRAEVTMDPLPVVTADADQLGQVFQNLISNAIKFRRDEQFPRIHIGVRREKNRWVFSVSDNGIGIAPEYFDRVFVPFKRLHTREKYPGTGIGLAICRKIVERHGGQLWVESQPGKGSTFHFSIPERSSASS